MHIRYEAEADVLVVQLSSDAPADAIEEPGGVVVSYSEAGEPVSVELLNASKRRLVGSHELSVTLQSAVTR